MMGEYFYQDTFLFLLVQFYMRELSLLSTCTSFSFVATSFGGVSGLAGRYGGKAFSEGPPKLCLGASKLKNLPPPQGLLAYMGKQASGG